MSKNTAAPKPRATQNRSTTPTSEGFKSFIANNWAPADDSLPPAREGAGYASARRAQLSAKFVGKRIIIPAGSAKVRSNDTDYPFRAHSAFSYLTAWGSDSEPDSVLVAIPNENGHDFCLYFRERAGRDSDEFYANPQIGEFWIGTRPSLQQVAADLALKTARLETFEEVLAGPSEDTIILREADQLITDRIDGERLLALGENQQEELRDLDQLLAQELSELRLVKDSWEVAELRQAIAATAKGFNDIITQFETISAHERGERLIEGIFYTHARAEGNAVGYDTIAASGPNACVLHWTRNTGKVAAGDLVLIDAGIELESLYTADITRTLPVSGTFTEVQRRVYEAVREAADYAFSIVRPGIRFRDIHQAAMQVIAQKTADWGLLPVSAELSLEPQNQFHRRYMVHGTSHHLGLDVHDCAKARRELYLDGILEPGMVFTIEPGLYFQSDDLSVPEEYRGIGVRIEDNILVTESGAENLSIAIPRTADEVEAWIAEHSR